MSEPVRVPPTFDAPLMVRPPATPAAAPTPSVAPATAAPPPPAASAPRGRVFVSDQPQAGEGADPALLRVAELVAHRGAEGPFVVGLLGPAGSGKSGALAALVSAVATLSKGAESGSSPFAPRILTLPLDASDIAADPRAALAERLHGALARGAPDVAAAAAEEASHASSDPHAHARALNESLDAARRRLDAERKARDDAETRRARLVETILYDSGGSRLDSYARANRASIDAALAAFGLTKGDTLATYKGLVHTLAESGGSAARAFASLRALWAYRGQGKRIVWAIIFLAIAWGFGALRDNQGWLDPLNSGGDTLQSVANSIRNHLNWFSLARNVALLGALACVLSLLWRAIRFQAPLLRGASLLDADVAARRGEIDNLVAHHAQRVEALGGETDALARRAADAERRAGAATPVQAATPAFLTNASAPDQARQAYLAAVAARLGRGAAGAPGRVLVALDNLDRLAPTAALSLLETMSAALDKPPFVLAAAFDPARVSDGAGPSASERLTRVVQVPLRVTAGASTPWPEKIATLAAPRAAAKEPSLDASQSPLDMPLDDAEQTLLAGLAPLASSSPRGLKRFVNLYRLGRHDAAEDLAAFAFMLALSIGGTAEERAAMDRAMASGERNAPLPRENLSARVQGALDAILALQGHNMATSEALRAKALAARWSL